MDRLRDGLSRLFELDRVLDLAGNARVCAQAEPQPDVGVGAYVPYPTRDDRGALDRQCGWTQLNYKRPVTAWDRADAFAACLSALAPGRGQHGVSGWRPERDQGEYQRAQDASVSVRTQKTAMLGLLLDGRVANG